MEPAALEQHIADLEIAIERLRSLYDQYFMGIERLEPQVPRKEVDRKIHILRKEQIRNTALRFRFQMVLQRYSMFQSLWQRICREIENGTYKRQLIRSALRRGPILDDAAPAELSMRASALAEPGDPPSSDLASELAAELAELDQAFAPVAGNSVPSWDTRTAVARAGPPAERVIPSALKPAASAKHTPPLKPAAPAGPASSLPPLRPPAVAEAASSRRDEGLPDYRIRQLYVEYVEAKRRQKESTAAITYEGLAESLRSSSAKLREKHGKPVDFEVSVKDGKAILRARVK